MTTKDKTTQGKAARDGAAVRRRAMGVVCLVLLMVAGCAPQPEQVAKSATPEPSLSGAASSRPAVSASDPLSARDQQIAAGAEAIRAYRQMIFDIYAAPSPNVQDMRKVATGQLLDDGITEIQEQLDAGWKNSPGTVSVKWVKPVSIGPKEMRLYACVDPNGILTGRSASPTHSAKTQAIDYVVAATSAGWRVSGTFTGSWEFSGV